MKITGNGNHNRDVRIVNWPHWHGVGTNRKEHAHPHDVRDERHHAKTTTDHG